MAELGLELFSPKSPGSSVTAVRAPKGLDSGVIVKGIPQPLRRDHRQRARLDEGQIFRIAHLGYFDFADLFSVIAGLEIILEANGHPVKLGSGVAAVQRVYMDVAMAKATARQLTHKRPFQSAKDL